MYDQELLCEKLSQVAEALARVARRFANIHSADDFLDTEQGQDMLDSICMMLIAVGENFKSIDRSKKGSRLCLTHFDFVGEMSLIADFAKVHIAPLNRDSTG